MNHSWLSSICLALAVATTIGSASGCAQATAASPKLGWPFAKKAEQEPHVPTADERIKAWRELAKNAKNLSPAEQDQKTNELISEARKEPDPLLRAEILRALGAFPTVAAGSELYAGIQDSDPDIRTACCQAWARRGGPDAARVLGDVLKNDEKTDVRLAAARALAQVKDQAAVVALAPALEDPNPAMQWRAVQSLEKVTGKHFGNDVNAWRAFVQGGNPREESIVRRIGRLFY